MGYTGHIPCVRVVHDRLLAGIGSSLYCDGHLLELSGVSRVHGIVPCDFPRVLVFGGRHLVLLDLEVLAVVSCSSAPSFILDAVLTESQDLIVSTSHSVVNLSTSQVLCRFGGSVRCAVLGPLGDTIVIGRGTGQVEEYLEFTKAPRRIGQHHGGVMAVAVGPQGHLVTGGEDRTLRTWRNGVQHSCTALPGRVWSVGMIGNTVIAASGDGTVVAGDTSAPLHISNCWSVGPGRAPGSLVSSGDDGCLVEWVFEPQQAPDISISTPAPQFGGWVRRGMVSRQGSVHFHDGSTLDLQGKCVSSAYSGDTSVVSLAGGEIVVLHLQTESHRFASGSHVVPHVYLSGQFLLLCVSLYEFQVRHVSGTLVHRVSSESKTKVTSFLSFSRSELGDITESESDFGFVWADSVGRVWYNGQASKVHHGKSVADLCVVGNRIYSIGHDGMLARHALRGSALRHINSLHMEVKHLEQFLFMEPELPKVVAYDRGQALVLDLRSGLRVHQVPVAPRHSISYSSPSLYCAELTKTTLTLSCFSYIPSITRILSSRPRTPVHRGPRQALLHCTSVTGVVGLSQGVFITASEDGLVTLSDETTVLDTLDRHKRNPIRALTVLNGSQVVTGGAFRHLQVIKHESESLELVCEVETSSECDIRILCLAGLGTDYFAAGNSIGTVEVYDFNCELLDSFSTSRPVLCMGSFTSQLVIGDTLGYLSVLDTPILALQSKYRVHQSGINGLALLGDRVYTVGDDECLVVSHLPSLEELARVRGTSAMTDVSAIGLEDQVLVLAIGLDSIIRVWTCNGNGELSLWKSITVQVDDPACISCYRNGETVSVVVGGHGVETLEIDISALL